MNEARTFLIIGFLAAGALILALGFLVGGRKNGDAVQAVPPLYIVAPAAGDSADNPVVLRFRTPAPLRLDAREGWMAGELHLHAMVDGVEVMPAADHIRAAGDSMFDWQLPRLPAGSHRIHLTWAGRHHGNLPGIADTLTLHVVR